MRGAPGLVSPSRGDKLRQTTSFPGTFTPMGNLEAPINLTCISMDSWRKLNYLERANADIEQVNTETQG